MRTRTAGLAAAALLLLTASCDYGLTEEEASAVEGGAVRLRNAGPVAPLEPTTTGSEESAVSSQAPSLPAQARSGGSPQHEQTPKTFPGVGVPIRPGSEP